MLNIIIKCDGCGENQNVADTQSRLADEIIIKVVPCGCSSEPDCSECEDIEIYKEQITKLQQQIDESKKEK